MTENFMQITIARFDLHGTGTLVLYRFKCCEKIGRLMGYCRKLMVAVLKFTVILLLCYRHYFIVKL